MFYLVSFAFILGIALRSLADFELFYLYLGLLLAIVIYIFERRFFFVKYLIVGVFFLFLGFLRLDLAQVESSEVKPDYLAFYNEQTVDLVGMIVDEPDIREQTIKYTVGEVYLLGASQTLITPIEDWRSLNKFKLKGKLLVTQRLYPRWELGQKVAWRCQLQRPIAFKRLAYDKYLASSGIYSLCYYPQILDIIPESETSFDSVSAWLKFKKDILKIKNNFIVQSQKILPAPHRGLLAGLLMGDITGVPNYLKQAFIDTGTIHIVAISGYNITIIIGFFLLIAPYLYLSRRRAWILIIPALGFFVIITGMEASVVRATIMGLIAALAQGVGRLCEVKRLLIMTALVMLLINPYLLIFDAGFQLSFLATLGLIYITPRLDAGLQRLKLLPLAKVAVSSGPLERQVAGGQAGFRARLKALKARCLTVWNNFLTLAISVLGKAGATTIGANLAVAPVLLWQFGRISLIAPVVNILILWVVPLAMAVGFLAILASYIFLPLGKILGWFSWLLLEYIIEVVKQF